jgi:hypothetical protein
MEAQTSSDKTAVTQSAPANNRRRSLLIVGGVAAVVALIVFAGGAFAVGRLSAPDRGGEGRFFGQRPNFQIEPAKELPTTTPNVRGLVTKRADNTLSVGQRSGGPGAGENGNTTLVDVVVTGDTTIYHEITQTNFNGQPPSGAMQQKVEPGALDSINTNSRVTVWGDQNGNQITAKVLVYTDPIAFQQPQ